MPVYLAKSFSHPLRYLSLMFALLAIMTTPAITVLAAPTQQTFGPSPVLYEPNVGFGGLQFRDSNSFDIRWQPRRPLYNVNAIEQSSDGSWLFVGQDNIVNGAIVGSLTLVDLTTGQVLDSINFPFLGLSECRPNSLAVLPDNSKVYVACGVNGFVEVVNINPTTGQLSRGTPLFTGNPQSAQYANGFVWVANHQGTTLVRIDPLNDTTRVVVNTSPFLMDEGIVDPLRPYAYISHIFNNRLLIADLSNGTILQRTITLAGEPIDLHFSPDGERLYVTVDNGEGNGRDHIAVIEGLGGGEQVIATIPVGEAASYLATNDEGSCLFTWDFADGYRRLDVIDTAFTQLSAQPIINGGGANGDFIAPGASPQALFLEPNMDNVNIFAVPESMGTVRLHVRRSCASHSTVSVTYATQATSSGGDPAVAGVDYQPVNGVLTFVPGEVVKSIEIPIIDNSLYGQGPRTFDLALSGPDGAFLGSRFVDTVQINDDDAIPDGADLSVALYDSPDPANVGDELTYYLEVRNEPTNFGSDSATEVLATIQLPANVGFVGATVENNPGGGGGGDFFAASATAQPATGQCDTPAVGQSGTVVCAIGDLNPSDQGAYGAVTIQVQVLAAAADSTLTASASASTTTFDPFPANNDTTTTTYVNPATSNQPPSALDDNASTTTGTAVTIPVLNNDSDNDGDALSVSAVGEATSGQTSTDGVTVSYTPNPTFSGNDSFIYTISDGRGGSAMATVQVVVTAATRITILLDNRPDANQNIRFTGSGPIRRFVLDDNTPQDTDAYSNSRSFDLAPGSYTITETIPTNRLLTAIHCTGGNTNVDLSGGAVSIALASGKQVTCTFVNERPVTIRGRVYDDRNHNGRRSAAEPFLASWQFTLYQGNTTTIVASAQTDSSTLLASFTQLPAGEYTLCETLPAGWITSAPVGLTAPYNQPCRSVTLAPGQVATLLFGSYQQVAAATAATTGDATNAEEPSAWVVQEAVIDENTDAADAEWLEEATFTATTRLFLPLLRR